MQSSDIPDSIGVVGGPPCQSWSVAGAGRGLSDRRGQVFLEYIRVIRDKKPLEEFNKLGYHFTYKLLNVKDYGVPEDRKRVIFVGYSKKLGKAFTFPEPVSEDERKVLRDAIWDLKDNAVPALDKNKTNGDKLKILNHEYLNGGFSTIYMSRNRVRSWDEPSFTIQAGGRHAPIHPQAPKMIKVDNDKQEFVKGKENYIAAYQCAK